MNPPPEGNGGPNSLDDEGWLVEEEKTRDFNYLLGCNPEFFYGLFPFSEFETIFGPLKTERGQIDKFAEKLRSAFKTQGVIVVGSILSFLFVIVFIPVTRVESFRKSKHDLMYAALTFDLIAAIFAGYIWARVSYLYGKSKSIKNRHYNLKDLAGLMVRPYASKNHQRRQ